jgi:hypothetical protein
MDLNWRCLKEDQSEESSIRQSEEVPAHEAIGTTALLFLFYKSDWDNRSTILSKRLRGDRLW